MQVLCHGRVRQHHQSPPQIRSPNLITASLSHQRYITGGALQWYLRQLISQCIVERSEPRDRATSTWPAPNTYLVLAVTKSSAILPMCLTLFPAAPPVVFPSLSLSPMAPPLPYILPMPTSKTHGCEGGKLSYRPRE